MDISVGYECPRVLMEEILQSAAILLWRKQWKQLSVNGCTQCVSTPEGNVMRDWKVASKGRDGAGLFIMQPPANVCPTYL